MSTTKGRQALVLSALMSLFMGAVLATWAWASPPGSAADDDFHLATIWCAWGPNETCVPEGTGAFVPEVVAGRACFAGDPNLNATCIRLESNDELAASEFINTGLGGYPEVFHAALGAFVGPDSYRSVLLMRTANAALASFILFWALASATTRVRRALAAAWLVCLVPTAAFFIPSTNPSSWAIVGCGTFWGFLATATSPGLGKRQKLIAGSGAVVSASLALGARSDSAVVIGLSVIGVAILRWGQMSKRSLALLSVAVIGVAGLVAALFRFGAYFQQYRLHWPRGNAEFDQPNPLVKTFLELPAFVHGLVGAQAPSWIQRDDAVNQGVPGYSWHGLSWTLGWSDLGMPTIVGALGGLALASAIALGLRDFSRAKALVLAVFVGVGLAQVAVMRSFVNFEYNWGLQSRWFLPWLLAAVGFLSLVRSRDRSQPAQAALIGLAVIGSGVAAFAATMSRYVSGRGSSWLSFDTTSGWWWPSGPTPTWLIAMNIFGSLGFALAGMTLMTSRRPHPQQVASRKGVSAL